MATVGVVVVVEAVHSPLICNDLAEVISGANSACGTLISPSVDVSKMIDYR
jgi:hypothetical protein